MVIVFAVAPLHFVCADDLLLKIDGTTASAIMDIAIVKIFSFEYALNTILSYLSLIVIPKK